MMKRFFTLSTALVLCVALAGSVAAFEGASLQKQNSFSLYDESDPLDLSVAPEYLYQIDRWRLYTNLSNYEGSTDYPVEEDGLGLIEDVIDLLGLDLDFDQDELDGSFYMIGTSGKLGPGSLAFFYETNKLEDEDSASAYDYYGREYTDPTSTELREFTGQDDYWDTDLNGQNFDLEDEAHNFLAAYSMDFGLFSLGLAYEPQFQTREQTLSDYVAVFGFPLMSFGYDSSMVDGPASWNAFQNDYSNIVPGLNHSSEYNWQEFGNTGHTTWEEGSTIESFVGDEEIEDRNHEFNIGSHIRPTDQYHIFASLMYQTVDRDVDGQGTYSYDWQSSQTGADTAGPTEFGVIGADDGYLATETVTSTWNGAFTDRERDGDIWGLHVRPSHHVNDVVQVDLLLAYASGNGDLGGGWTQVVDYEETYKADATDTEIQTWTGHEEYYNTMDGDWDSQFYSIEPRVYLKYDNVRFSLGMGYSYSEEEEDWVTRQDAESSFSYIDGDTEANDPDDWSATGTRTHYSAESNDTEVTSWRFPVATEFDITEKLTIRAGACFTRQTTERDYSRAETWQDVEEVIGTSGDGTELFTPGPEDYQDIGGVRTPYDPYTDVERVTEKQEVTDDRTDYRLGLGYQASEHLAFDLMFAGSNGDNGGVDTRTIWASATLAF